MILFICDVPEVLKVMRIIKIVIDIIKIAVPIILMVSLMIDYTKATMANDSDALLKANKLSAKKAIAVVLVFMIPTFVNVITNVVLPGFSYSACINNATKEGIRSAYENVMEGLMAAANEKMDNASYSVAQGYLKNIENEDLKKRYEEELKVIYDKLEEERNKKNPASPPITEGPDPKAPYQKGLLKGATFLQTAKNVWERIVLGDKNFTYEQGNYVPVTTSYCDCSTYVSWVLYEFGYEDFAGRQKVCRDLYHTNYKEKYGWEEYYYPARTDLTNIVQPGDIVVRRTEESGHTDIIASIQNGVVYGYDCGNSDNVKHGKYPNGVPNPYFITDSVKHRPAKIIRVTPPNN